MQTEIELLGKVSLTAEGAHNINRAYDRVSLVTVPNGGGVDAYISKKYVPAGIPIVDTNYWEPLFTHPTSADVNWDIWI